MEKGKEHTSEIFVFEVFGIPIFRKYVEFGDAGEVASSKQNAVLAYVKIFMIISMVIPMVIVLTTGVYVLFYTPPFFTKFADSFLESYSAKGKVDVLEKSLNVCEAEKRVLNATWGNFVSDYGKIVSGFKKEKENFCQKENEFRTTQNNIESMRTELKEMGKSEKEYQRREQQLNHNMTLLNERYVTVEEELVKAKETMREMGEREIQLERSLEDEQILIQNLKMNLTESMNDTIEIAGILSTAKKINENTEQHNRKLKEDKEELEKKYETEAQQAKIKIDTTKDNIKHLNTKMDAVTADKSIVTEKLKDAEVKLGQCIARNTRYELSSSKLLSENQQAKKDFENLKEIEIEQRKDKEQFETRLNNSNKDLQEIKTAFSKSQERENKLKDDLNNVTIQKSAADLKVDNTEIILGKCRNKNMDHEIEKADVLKKLQKAEKELKNCR